MLARHAAVMLASMAPAPLTPKLPARHAAVMLASLAPAPFAPANSAGVADPDVRWALGRMRRVTIAVPGVGDVPTTFYEADEEAPSDAPTVLFLHGGDSSCLEWRSITKRLAGRARCVAVDWWSGGWTARAPITAAVCGGQAPWEAIRAHVRAFWEQHLGGSPVCLVGTSMGGAVAIDFATCHPDAISRLALIDSGGESYAAPPPAASAFLAPFCPSVLRALAWLAPRLGPTAALSSLHRTEPGWIDAYVAYLGSGGYERAVGPEQIRQISQPTLVVWGSDDAVLSPSDASAFASDLGDACERVVSVEGAGHAPHADDPDAVARALAEHFGLIDCDIENCLA